MDIQLYREMLQPEAKFSVFVVFFVVFAPLPLTDVLMEQIEWWITAFVIICCYFSCPSVLHTLVHSLTIWFCTIQAHNSDSVQSESVVPAHLRPLLLPYLTPLSLPRCYTIHIPAWFFCFVHLLEHYELALSVCSCLLFGAVGGLRTEQNWILISTPPRAFCETPSASETFLWCWVCEEKDERWVACRFVLLSFFFFTFLGRGVVSWLCTITMEPAFNEEPVY